MQDYISATVGHYKGQAFAWDVLNEAIEDDGSGLRKNAVFSKVNDFACKAFHMAHKADPDAQLFYNDYSIASATGWS